MEPNECRWRGCPTPAAFTMARVSGHGDRFHYCDDHIGPAVAEWHFEGPPSQTVVVTRCCYLCGGPVHRLATTSVCDNHH
jgi:hypothetical protein